MKVSQEMFARWSKYVRLLLAESNRSPDDITTPKAAWDIAYKLEIPKEAYHCGLQERHIDHALRSIFPKAWTRLASKEDWNALTKAEGATNGTSSIQPA